jgi:hypothetical protein
MQVRALIPLAILLSSAYGAAIDKNDVELTERDILDIAEKGIEARAASSLKAGLTGTWGKKFWYDLWPLLVYDVRKTQYLLVGVLRRIRERSISPRTKRFSSPSSTASRPRTA